MAASLYLRLVRYVHRYTGFASRYTGYRLLCFQYRNKHSRFKILDKIGVNVVVMKSYESRLPIKILDNIGVNVVVVKRYESRLPIVL